MIKNLYCNKSEELETISITSDTETMILTINIHGTTADIELNYQEAVVFRDEYNERLKEMLPL